MQTKVRNRVAEVRQRRGVAAADLARRVGVSRQTIYAIEAGSYVPNTEVTLKLSRELEVSVEELFSLEGEKSEPRAGLKCELLSATEPAKGQAVRIGRVGNRLVSVPVNASPYYLSEADGVISKVSRPQKNAELFVFSDEDGFRKRLLLAGCDPAVGLVASMVEKAAGIDVLTAAASSKLALHWLKEGKVHIAGSHLQDPSSGDFNVPYVRREFPNDDLVIITFARWEEGIVTARRNPKAVMTIADFARKDVRMINREEGSGSRALLDRLLGEAGIAAKKIHGYDRVAHGHLAVAYAVYSEQVDCCLATRSAAQAFGLAFTPIQNERYDFVMLRQTLELPAARAFVDTLQKASLRRKLEGLAGYDTSQTGSVVV